MDLNAISGAYHEIQEEITPKRSSGTGIRMATDSGQMPCLRRTNPDQSWNL